MCFRLPPVPKKLSAPKIFIEPSKISVPFFVCFQSFNEKKLLVRI